MLKCAFRQASIGQHSLYGTMQHNGYNSSFGQRPAKTFTHAMRWTLVLGAPVWSSARFSTFVGSWQESQNLTLTSSIRNATRFELLTARLDKQLRSQHDGPPFPGSAKRSGKIEASAPTGTLSANPHVAELLLYVRKGGDGFVSADPFADQEDAHDAPPPPYESVVMNEGEVARASGSVNQVPAANKSDFQIKVSDPVKHGDGVGAYVSYKVQTRTTLEQYSKKENEVIRRFRDFAWLHSRLQEQNRGIIIPPLPEKNVVQKYQMQTDFIEQRRRALQVYINRVIAKDEVEAEWRLCLQADEAAAHPSLQGSSTLQRFLEASEEDWALEMSRAAAFGGSGPASSFMSGSSGTKSKLDRTLQLFRDLGHSTASLVHGKHDEEDEDPEYLKVKDYVLQLEAHLVETHRQAQRLIKRQSELGSSLGDFGSSLLGLGKFEQSPLADQFIAMGEKSSNLATTSKEQAEALEASFEAPLKEFVRLVKSAKLVMADRSSALQAVHQARGDVDAKRNKLAKLRGVAGIKEEKIAEAERELNEAAHKVDHATQTYELIVRRMSEDLARFQRERTADLAAVLKGFAVSQAKLASDTAKVWRQLLPDAAVNGQH